MLDDEKLKVVTANEVEAENNNQGRYLYCVADSGAKVGLGQIGIDGQAVYTIPYIDLCAVVHNCPFEPYKSNDNEVVKKWVLTHEKVVEIAWERFSAVLPAGFDTIVKGEEDTTSEENIKKWLNQEYVNLKEKMNRIRGKAEYGVQIFWDLNLMADEIARTDQEIRSLNQNIKSKSKGMAYMLKQKLENLLRKKLEKKAHLFFEDFYVRIETCADEIRVEKTKKIGEKRQMFMNLSCLVKEEKSKELGEELERINMQDGFAVHYTGPWPPYSFVAMG